MTVPAGPMSLTVVFGLIVSVVDRLDDSPSHEICANTLLRDVFNPLSQNQPWPMQTKDSNTSAREPVRRVLRPAWVPCSGRCEGDKLARFRPLATEGVAACRQNLQVEETQTETQSNIYMYIYIYIYVTPGSDFKCMYLVSCAPMYHGFGRGLLRTESAPRLLLTHTYNICMFIYSYISLFIFVYIYICVYIYMYIYIYIYIFICLY